ncbi:MAG: class I SAM-dependent methyltransferase [Trichodesmium sp. St17_bin3_1_1]|nr:class I SAM-dependent methyltransferase [Trichodesmium sp. St17_bin3_1_1]
MDNFLHEGLSGMDIADIDGHHEKLATLRYCELIKPMLNPDSVVIFDDIYWSQDMYDAWTILRQMNGVKVSINAGKFGS